MGRRCGEEYEQTTLKVLGRENCLFPMVLKLAQRRCLVRNAGKTAEETIPTLFRSRAHVVGSAAARTVPVSAVENKLVWLDINTRDAQALQLQLHDRAGVISPSGPPREPNYKQCTVAVELSPAPKVRVKSRCAANFSAGVSQWND
jgi:hypothetical protein